MKVSIIIPVYNVAPYLDFCLSSCINQTFNNIEIIVVNDGSTDESPDIIASYAEKDARIKVITKENQGLIYARKSGLDVALGEYVFHLDGDDYIETNTIEELYSKAINSESDYVMGHFYSVCKADKYELRYRNNLDGLSGQNLLFNMLYRGWSLCGILFHKSLFDNLVYYPVFMGEDLFLNMQIAFKVRNAVVVDKCFYNYIDRSDSVTRQKKETISLVHNLTMVKSIFYLLGIYSYNKQIRDWIYLMFFPFYLYCISHRRMEIKNHLYEYYWSKKDIMAFLWRKRKDYYFIISTFFLSPLMGSLMAKIYLQILSLRRRCGKFVFKCKNKHRY